MTKFLITGGTGFIGSHITRFLVNEGHSVRVLDDNTRGKNSRIGDIISDIELIEGDVSNFSLVESACKNIDTVIHLAFINGTSNFYNHPDKVLNVAIKGILSIASAISKWNIKDLILASSSEVYQFPDVFPTPEDIQMVVPDLANPRYSYGLGKIVQEYYSYHAIQELENLTIFRPHNIYGSDMGNLHVVPQLFEKAIKAKNVGGEFLVEGTGAQTRSFCHINDFIQGFALILKNSKDKQVFNIGTSEEVTIGDLAGRIAKICDVKSSVLQSEMPAGGTLRRVPDISKLEALGYKPMVSLDSGLNDYFRQLQEPSTAGGQ
jgi:nucleoside-diphosphate-sugar epimerase